MRGRPTLTQDPFAGVHSLSERQRAAAYADSPGRILMMTSGYVSLLELGLPVCPDV
jgi:hypothetical protein